MPGRGAPPLRRYSAAEERADAVIHGVALAFSLFALAFLVWSPLQGGDAADVAILGTYGLTLVALYGASALNQYFRFGRYGPVFRLVDHATIFLLIAGTYTPVALLGVPGARGQWLLTIVWLLAGVGIALKLAFGHRYDRLALLLYLAMGWMFLPLVGAVAEALGVAGMSWLVGGGLLYTVGILFHLRDHRPFANVVWHGFCLGGSVAHFVLVAAFLR